MQVAACEAVTVVAPEDVDQEFLAKERAIEMEKEDLKSKPENIREKIVDGRMAKRVNEVALLEQPFIKDTDKTVGEVVKAAIAKIGENIKVRRFVKYNLGEGLEKRNEDFAAEVQTLVLRHGLFHLLQWRGKVCRSFLSAKNCDSPPPHGNPFWGQFA